MVKGGNKHSYTMKAYGGPEGTAPSFLTQVLDGGGNQLDVPAALFTWKQPPAPK
jgi:hypothetical protein